jgi:hypothetical protein
METEEIVRNDFSKSFRGWNPREVRRHLVEVAAEMKKVRERPISDEVATQILDLLDEAEDEADGIMDEAERVLQRAEDDARAIRLEAERDAARRVAEAEMAFAEFIAEAVDLGERVDQFGIELARSFGMNPTLPVVAKRRFARAAPLLVKDSSAITDARVSI